MGKKKLILLIVFLALIPFMFMTGQSSWIIVNNTILTVPNEYYPIQVDREEEYVVYDGRVHDYTYISDDEEVRDNVYLSYYLVDEETRLPSDTPISGKPINVGTYYTKMYYDMDLGGVINRQLVDTALLIITPSPRIIKLNNHIITYGDEPSNNGYVITNLVNNEYVEAPLYNEDTNESVVITNSYKQWDNVGTYEDAIGIDLASSKLNSNYSWTYIPGDLTVQQKSVNIDWVVDNDGYTYTGNSVGPTASIKGIFNNDDVSLNITYDDVTAGDRTATAQLIGSKADNYSIVEGQDKVGFKINKATPVDPNYSATATYGDLLSSITLLPGMTLAGYSDETQVGNIGVNTFNVIYNPDPNNYVDLETTITIEVAQKELTLEWNVSTYIYNGNPQGPTATINGVINNDDVDITIIGIGTTAGKHTAIAELTGAGIGNYYISNPECEYTIDKATYDISGMKFEDLSVEYDSESHSIEVTGVPSGVEVSYTNNAQITVGEYVVTASFTGDSNYNNIDSITATLTITQKMLTVSWIVGTYTYNGNVQGPTARLASGVIDGDDVSITVTGKGTNAGSHTATAELQGEDSTNYYIEEPNLTYSIAKQPYDISGIKFEGDTEVEFDSKSHELTLSGMNPAFTAEIVITNDEGVVVEEAKHAGTYTFTATITDTSNNYELSGNTVVGTLTILNNSVMVNVSVSDVEITYGEQFDVTSTIVVTLDDGTNVTNEALVGADYSIKYYQIVSGVTVELVVKPSAANTYTYTITFNELASGYLINGKNECSGTIIINKKVIKLSGTVEIDYNSSSMRTWDQISTKIHSSLYFVDSVTNIKVSLKLTDYTVDGMQDGTYGYGTLSITGLNTKMTYVVGSTYYADVTVSNNYELVNNQQLVKYKTVLIGSTYYTIEDAISNSGNITLVGDASTDSSYVVTAFSNILTTNSYTISDSRKLRVPYDNVDGEFKCEYKNSLINVYSGLYIPEGITLTVSNRASIEVGAILDASGACERRGVLMNDGDIIIKTGSAINSYGFTKGNGLITLESGASAMDVFYLGDWPGADEALDLVDQNAFPVKKWRVHNISCATKIMNNATYNSVSYVVIMNGDINFEVENVYVIGNASTQNCLFKPGSNAKSTDYIIKKAEIPNDGFTVTNQSVTQKDIIEIYGEYLDSTVMVSIKYLFFNYSFATSTTVAIPIDYFEIIVKEGSKLSLVNSSYVALSSNASVTVEEDAVLSIDGDAYMALLNGSVLTLNGQLIGSGRFGGLVESTVENAILNISNLSVDGVIVKTGTKTSDTYQTSATGNIEGVVNSTFENKAYTSTTDDGNTYYWITATDINVFNINFYDENNQLILTKEVTVVNADTYTVTGYEYIPTKLHYDFAGWLTSDGVPLLANTQLTLDSNSIDLYASYDEHEYRFIYSYGYGYNEEGKVNYLSEEDVTLDDYLETFTISDFNNGILQITTKASYNDLNWYGWYVGIDKSNVYKIQSVTIEQLELFISEFDYDGIPLYCEFSEGVYIDVNFVDPNGNFTFDSIEALTGESLGDLLPTATGMDYEPSYQYYFYRWVGSDGNIYDKDTLLPVSLTELTLTIEWKTKEYKVHFYEGTSLNESTVKLSGYTTRTTTTWYKEGTEVFSVYNTQRTEKGHTLIGWSWTKRTDGIYDYDKGATIDMADVSFVNGEVTLYASYSVSTVTFNVSLGSNVNSAVIIINSTNYTISESTSYPLNYGTAISYGSISYASDYEKDEITYSPSLTSGRITEDTTLSITAKEKSCIASGTLITLADGSKKKVEDLTLQDTLLVFNHETGQYEEASILFIEDDGYKYYNVINLEFSNGTVTRLIYEHALFDLTLNKYVYITESNYKDFIGHEFAVETDSLSGFERVTLVEANITYEYTGCYSLVTVYHLNYFIDGLFSIPGGIYGLFNIFEYDKDTLQYDQALMQEDIKKYGLYTYDDFKDYLPYEVYLAFPAEYFKVSVGKGMITYEEILQMIELYLVRNGVI